MKKSGAMIGLTLSICLLGCSQKSVSEVDTENIDTFDKDKIATEVSSISENIDDYEIVDLNDESKSSTSVQLYNDNTTDKKEQTEFDKKIQQVKEDGFTGEELELMSEVNRRMSDVAESQAFKNAHVQDRYIMMNNLLTKLQDEELIKDLKYDEGTFMFSFKYANDISGGWLLKDFSTYMN